MTLTKERKILFVALAIGAVALLTDRILLSGGSAGPSDAAASDLIPLPAEVQVELAGPVSSPGAPVSEPSPWSPTVSAGSHRTDHTRPRAARTPEPTRR